MRRIFGERQTNTDGEVLNSGQTNRNLSKFTGNVKRNRVQHAFQ